MCAYLVTLVAHQFDFFISMVHHIITLTSPVRYMQSKNLNSLKDRLGDLCQRIAVLIGTK
jgi:hypothetical protein